MSKVEFFQGVKPINVVKYMVLPGIIPRIRELVGSGFGWLALLMASIYGSVRLLPAGHPYLQPENKGRFGIRHVIAEAANNLVIKRSNADQIIIFVALMMGFIILCVQFALLIFGFVIAPAFAGSYAGFAGIFQTPGCTSPGDACPDIAFMLLDKVFAIPDFYNSRFAPASAGAIPAFNRALQLLFNYYNLAILLVGVLIFLYYVIVIVAETAQSGTPFGRRFSHIYAPMRLVLAIGLLVPINYGFNSAQYITLAVAKYGSSMATNAWIAFNTTLPASVSPVGERPEALIARPRLPDIRNLVTFMSIVKTCEALYERAYPASSNNQYQIEPYFVKNDPAAVNELVTLLMSTDPYAFYDNKDIIIRFGRDVSGSALPFQYKGNIEPTCGEIIVRVDDVTQIGARRIQERYFFLVQMMWHNAQLRLFGERAAAIALNGPPTPADITGFTSSDDDDSNSLPGIGWKQDVINHWQTYMQEQLTEAYDLMLAGTDFDVPPELIEQGWGGAGIWYNHIAEWNGSFFSAAINTPTPSKLPLIMEKVQSEKSTNNINVTTNNQFEPHLGTGDEMKIQLDDGIKFARAFNDVYKYWEVDGQVVPGEMATSGNVFYDTLNAFLGVGGLFEMRKNDDIHPLAQLSAIGRSIVESSIRNLMVSMAFAVGGGVTQILNPHGGNPLQAASGIFTSLTTIGLSIGFILYYILPFLPFIYFFFAVGGWVKSVFEAMVGVPLWALAHLKIDGDGLPGDSASNGYFLLLEIFIRPILCVFGLVGGLAVFSAMAKTLNGIFDLVIANVAGFECVATPSSGPGGEIFGDCSHPDTINLSSRHNIVDEFFYTIIYTVLVYMLATSAFKMIDLIPNSILRWVGAGVQSFGDSREDPTQGLVLYAAIGGGNIAGQATDAMAKGSATAGMAGATVGAGAMRLGNQGLQSILGRSGIGIGGKGGG